MKSVLVSLHGRDFGLADDKSTVAAKGLRVGDFPRQFLQSGPQHVSEFDDFTGSSLLGTWAVAKGTDAACANFAIAAALNGVVQATTGAVTTTMAGSGVQITSALNFQANSGDLQFGTRIKLSSVANVAIFVGLTNQVAALQIPMQGAGGGNGFTVNAANCVGFLYDTTMTTKDWWGVSANANAATAGQDSGAAPAAATYDDLFIQVDAAGNTGFFLNGKPVGQLVQAALAVNVPLAPVVALFSRAAASVTPTVDYLYAANARV